ncbi:hypothetical protein B0H14DRAFT_2664824 [Mycena olivaceomarginata]|nr:hypothetical protein B0H14DRAFT_2664824 [Mycena olivaceomarginata]
MSHRTDRVRIVVLLKRKPTLSKEEFHKHGPKRMAHYDSWTTDWDGMAIFEAESYAKIFEVFQSEEYSKVIIPDDEKFVDRANWQMLPFDLNTVVDK